MGIINVTPDSFSDGGENLAADDAVASAKTMLAAGADILDVGGESSRPGAKPASARQELARVKPVVERLLAEFEVPVSVDTYKPEVAEKLLSLGVHMVNDINGLRSEGMAELVASYDVPCVVMHMKGTPADMQENPAYDDVVAEVYGFFEERVSHATSKGIRKDNIILDPGIGFGKTTKHNIQLLRNLGAYKKLGRPLLVGASRKSLIGQILELPVDQRLEGSLAACAVAVYGGAEIVRVHDVAETVRFVRMLDALLEAG